MAKNPNETEMDSRNAAIARATAAGIDVERPSAFGIDYVARWTNSEGVEYTAATTSWDLMTADGVSMFIDDVIAQKIARR